MMRLVILTLFILINIGCKKQPDVQSVDLIFPKNKQLSKSLINRIEKRKEGYYRVFKNDRGKIKNQLKESVIAELKQNIDYENIVRAEYWLAFNFKVGVPELIKLVTDDKEIGLKNYRDLIILERVESGDMNLDHGNLINDDIFKISGRANYLLKEITGQDFGNVTMKSTKKELQELQKKWIDWMKSLGEIDNKN